MNDTIAVLAVAYGTGSTSVIRVSGSRALEPGLKLSYKDELSPRYAYLVKPFNDENVFIDEAIMIYFKAPFSFTGKDVVGFQIHGSFSVSGILLDELLKNDVHLTRAGEFNKRMCLNGKANALKALNIRDLISAKPAKPAKVIAKNMQGTSVNLTEEIRLDLIKDSAFVETSINYADDSSSSDLMGQIRMMCEGNARILEEVYTLSQGKKALLEGFKIAIIDKSNAGKSSLLSVLLAYERAIVSSLIGTAEDFIKESFRIDIRLVKIIGTAGIRESEEELKETGTELSRKSLNEADIILALFNSSREFDEEDKEILDLSKNSGKEVFYLLDKCDLKPQLGNLNEIDLIKISAKEGIMPLKEALESYLSSLDSEGFLVSPLDFIDACRRANEAIQRTKTFLDEKVLEPFAFELNIAIEELIKFIRDFKGEEVLDEMFSNFCLGK